MFAFFLLFSTTTKKLNNKIEKKGEKSGVNITSVFLALEGMNTNKKFIASIHLRQLNKCWFSSITIQVVFCRLICAWIIFKIIIVEKYFYFVCWMMSLWWMLLLFFSLFGEINILTRVHANANRQLEKFRKTELVDG